MRQMVGILAVVVIAVAAVPSLTMACDGGIIEVVQPLVDQYGVHARTVSLSRSCIPRTVVPGYEVSFVAEPSCVCHDLPPSVDNRNAANLVRIKTAIDPFHSRTNGLLGDTLHVIMDLTSLSPTGPHLKGEPIDASIDEVVKATVKCILMTAYRGRRGISGPDSVGMYRSVYAEHVWLEVQGSEDYASLGGVFGLAYLDSLTRSEWW
jgi:hypothetical protein